MVWWEQHILALHVIAKQKFSITTHNFRLYGFNCINTQGKNISGRDQIISFTKFEIDTTVWPLQAF